MFSMSALAHCRGRETLRVTWAFPDNHPADGGGANRLMGEPGWLCEVRVVGRFDLDRRLSIWSGLRIAPRIMGRAGERNNAREQ
jgi:hypothetical protein